MSTWYCHVQVLLLLPEDTVEHQAAVLSFATLVQKVCSLRCAPETLDKYVGQYLNLFTGMYISNNLFPGTWGST